MRKKITLLASGLFLGLLGLNAQTTCSDDKVAYVNSKNTGSTGAYTLSVGAEEKAAQAYHYSGPGKVGGVRIYGSVPSGLGVLLRASLYNVDANDRPTGSPLATSSIKDFYTWSPSHLDISFSPAVSVSANFAVVVEVVHSPGWGHDFALQYTGNGEGLGEDLASLAGTSTGFNWASAMTAFSKDGDFYIYPRMINMNTPSFNIPSQCVNAGGTVDFTNTSKFTNDPMFNLITSAGYSGSNYLYTWNFGDGSAVSHAENPSHTYSTSGSYTVTLTTTIDGWDGDCSKSYSKTISVGLLGNTSSVTNVSCNDGSNGSVVISGTGGVTPYTYSINGYSYQSSASFSSLEAGSYTLYVKDALGCIKTAVFTITEPAAIVFTSATTTNTSCGGTDGGILVATTGGVGAMQYQLNAGTFQTSPSFSTLSAGAYTVTAKDANGCTSSVIVLVNDAGGPSFGLTNSTDVSCFAGNDGSITLSSLGGTGTIQYSINGGTTFQTSGNFTGLTAGTYTAVVKDAAGCTDIKTIVITQPQTLSFTASAIAVSCFGGTDGQINIGSVTGGTGAAIYSLDGIVYQSGTNFEGLTAGTYTVYARDVTGCINTVSVTVTEPTALTASVSVLNASCHDYQNGVITVTATGGTPAYTYGIEDDEEYVSTGSFNNLSAGTYDLVVNDANGCTYFTSATITQPTEVNPIATTTNSTCGTSNGGILVTATGGSGSGYTYALNGGAFGIGSFSSLSAGTYMVTALDGAGCSSSITASITDSDGPSILTSTHTNVTCNGGNDGSISIGSVTGGTGTLEYSVNGSTYQTSPLFTTLPAGTYNVTVKDAVGCIGNITVTITEPASFVMTSTVTDALCSGDETGSVSVLVGGGSGTLAYSIDFGVTYQSSNVFTGLEAGLYIVTVKDAGGCTGTTTVVIEEPSPVLAFNSVLDVSCNGANDGGINIYAWGGTGTFQYSIDGITYQTPNVFSGLDGGPYVVFIKDANGCIKNILTYVGEPAPLVVNGTVEDVTCAGGDNGVIDLSVSGGTSGYSFDWSNEVTTEDNFNLPAGTYTVDVTDAHGCGISLTYAVSEPAVPVIVNGTVTSATIGSSNGSIDITVTGGTTGYSFLWSNGATTEDVNGLAAGIYSVVVTDASGCSASSTFIVTSVTSVATPESLIAVANVYPNPATTFATVEAGGFNIERVIVYDAVGQITFQAEPKSSKVELNTSSLNQGIYLVKIYVDGQIITKKLKVIR